MTEDERRARMERALLYAGPTHRLEDVAAAVNAGLAKWHCNGDGMIVTEYEQYPLLKAVRFWLIAGELKACLALEDEILADAHAEGCDVAMATGRRGWGRAAAPTGWRLHSYNFCKPLTREVWRR